MHCNKKHIIMKRPDQLSRKDFLFFVFDLSSSSSPKLSLKRLDNKTYILLCEGYKIHKCFIGSSDEVLSLLFFITSELSIPLRLF